MNSNILMNSVGHVVVCTNKDTKIMRNITIMDNGSVVILDKDIINNQIVNEIHCTIFDLCDKNNMPSDNDE